MVQLIYILCFCLLISCSLIVGSNKDDLPKESNRSLKDSSLANPTVNLFDTLTENQAVAIAEDFIKWNGYTEFPADETKVSYESTDRFLGDKKAILRDRYNSLHPSAFCILKQENGRAIGFLSGKVDRGSISPKNLNTDLSGRAAIVNTKGEVRMEHKDPLFSYFRKL